VSDDRATYCREVEAYLCRRNDGHLIRIVGPTFDLVTGWAARGIPLPIVFRGIDRYCDRYYAKGPRRRPVQVAFCEADVLDLFDEWRRAVGVRAAVAETENGQHMDEDDASSRRKGSLAAHLERVIARLTALRSGPARPLDGHVADLISELDTARAGAKSVRGDAREALRARLRDLDTGLMRAARATCDMPTLEHLEAEAAGQLAPFRNRMTEAAYGTSKEACVDRLLREHLRLPVIAFD
jgi:hypothetical protein